MTDWSDLPDAPLAPLEARAEVVQRGRGKESQLEVIRGLEDQLLTESLAVIRDVVNFADIAEDEPECPQELIDAHGEVEAQKRFRRMKASWRSSKFAPAALGIAGSFATKVIHSRSAERAAPRALAIVFMPGPAAAQPTFEVRDVDDDDH